MPDVWSEQIRGHPAVPGWSGAGSRERGGQIGPGLAGMHTDGVGGRCGTALLDLRKLAGRVRLILAAVGSVHGARAALLR